MILSVTETRSNLRELEAGFWREDVPSAVRRRVKSGLQPIKLICSWGGKD